MAPATGMSRQTRSIVYLHHATAPKTPAKASTKAGTRQKRARSPEPPAARKNASTSKTDASLQPAKRARASTIISGACKQCHFST